MSGRNSFAKLRDGMAPAQRNALLAKVAALSADTSLAELRRFVEAMGGELDVIARFPEGSVKINNFAEIGDFVAP